MAETSSDESLRLWQNIWKAEVPPKIKNFGWRALQNGLAVRVNLVSRGMVLGPTCPRCRDGVETVPDMLMMCGQVEQVWYISPLRLSSRAWGD